MYINKYIFINRSGNLPQTTLIGFWASDVTDVDQFPSAKPCPGQGRVGVEGGYCKSAVGVPKPWPFYGRYDTLQGAIGLQPQPLTQR